MNRIKQAWLVLIGRAQALEISSGTAEKAKDVTRRCDGVLDDILDDALDVYTEEVASAVEVMVNERNVLRETKSIVTNAAKGI
ncbi:hypothetical protein [Streptomyces sp. 5-10]|uniref:hypothetical protein n=1 Tax=Streptomyces sp. 5-10 TaxID=878925 RepID=UPI00168AA05A|nr:hypothetical protein [Streptomyces sp. 5-10]MBD3004698.1 hypothetical protein [Streptomyces sp. 5-10]